MTTPSGQISLDDVNTELDISPGTQINMDAANVRALAEVPSGAIAMSNLQGNLTLNLLLPQVVLKPLVVTTKYILLIQVELSP